MSFQHNGFQQNAFQTGFADAAPVLDLGWDTPLNRPPTPPKRTPWQPSIFQSFFGDDAPYFVRHGLELPPQRPKRTPWQPYLFQSFTGDDPVYFAASAQGGDGPTFIKTVLYQSRAYVPPDDTVASTVFLQYHMPFSEPVRRKPRNPLTEFIVNPKHPGIDYLWAPMDGLELPPQRPKRTPSQPFLFLDPFPIENVAPPFTQHVFSELSARIFRYRRRAELDSQVPSDPSLFYPPFDHITWWMPLAEPTRRRPKLQAGAEPQLSFNFLETVAGMRWFMEMQRAVLPKDRRHIQDRYVLPAPQIAPYDWFIAMAEPKRNKRTWDWFKGLEAFPWGGWIEKFGMPWYLAMNEPKRRKPQLGAELQPPENTMYIRGNLPFAATGPLYTNNRGGRPLGFWRGRTRT